MCNQFTSEAPLSGDYRESHMGQVYPYIPQVLAHRTDLVNICRLCLWLPLIRVGFVLLCFQVEGTGTLVLYWGAGIFHWVRTCLCGLFALFIYLWSGSQVEGIGPLKSECCCHPPFPRRCHSCDKEGFIMAQFGAFIIYSLWFYALLVSCSTIH